MGGKVEEERKRNDSDTDNGVNPGVPLGANDMPPAFKGVSKGGKAGLEEEAHRGGEISNT
jgi:hypothetical protein